MCRKRSNPSPCSHYECPHNLFRKELELNKDRISVTKNALEIGNCCRLLRTPWTVEDIEAVWGIPAGETRQVEETAWKKIYRENGREEADKVLFS